MAMFSYGRARLWDLEASVQLTQISPNWGQVTFVMENAAVGERIDLQLWTLPRMGNDDERPHLVIVNNSQGVMSLVGEAYTLQVVTRPATGVASSVTPPTHFDVVMSSWAQVSTPLWGNPHAMTWSWREVPLHGGGTTTISLIFGVGDADFPTPVPLPEPRIFTLTGAWERNIRHLLQQTTARVEGWGGLIRRSGETTQLLLER
jgi:hypothetical protein